MRLILTVVLALAIVLAFNIPVFAQIDESTCTDVVASRSPLTIRETPSINGKKVGSLAGVSLFRPVVRLLNDTDPQVGFWLGFIKDGQLVYVAESYGASTFVTHNFDCNDLVADLTDYALVTQARAIEFPEQCQLSDWKAKLTYGFEGGTVVELWYLDQPGGQVFPNKDLVFQPLSEIPSHVLIHQFGLVPDHEFDVPESQISLESAYEIVLYTGDPATDFLADIATLLSGGTNGLYHMIPADSDLGTIGMDDASFIYTNQENSQAMRIPLPCEIRQ